METSWLKINNSNSLFAFNRFARCFKSALTSLFSFLIEFFRHKRLVSSAGVILGTEGSVWKILQRTLFHYKKVKKGSPNLTTPYVHSLFSSVLIKQIFEKKSH